MKKPAKKVAKKQSKKATQKKRGMGRKVPTDKTFGADADPALGTPELAKPGASHPESKFRNDPVTGLPEAMAPATGTNIPPGVTGVKK